VHRRFQTWCRDEVLRRVLTDVANELGLTLVVRKATTVLPDPYSGGGFCQLFRFEARVGGAVTCGNAARLLRIR
jgi:hypothetical protein